MNSSNGSMNRMYRVVWNAAKGVWQAVAEMAKGRGKTKSVSVGGAAVGGQALDLRRSALSMAVMTALAASATQVMAQPTGWVGSSVVDRGNPLTISTAFTDGPLYATGFHAVLDITSDGSVVVSPSGLAVAVRNYVSTTFSTTITNAGTISASNSDGHATGLSVSTYYESGTGAISLNNSGTITATGTDAYAVRVSQQNSLLTLTNSGTLSATGTSGPAFGIQINQSNLQTGSNISNSGTIEATSANGNAYGIHALSTLTGTSISNNDKGTIEVSANDRNALGIFVGAFADSSIVNAGTILVTSNIKAGTGIRAHDLIGASRIQNSGTLTVSGSSGAMGIYATTLSSGPDDSPTIENSGTLTVSGSSASGIYVHVARGSSSITNSKTLNVSATGGNGSNTTADGIGVGFLRDTATITNSGTITVNSNQTVSTSSRARGIYVYYSDSGTSIENRGTITATINDAGDRRAYSVHSYQYATVNNLNTGKLNGNLHVRGTLNNAGTISLPHNANNAYVNNFVNSGTLEIGVLTDGTTTTHSQLFTNTATFEAGSNIKVNVLAASTNEGLLVGQTLEDVLVAEDTLTLNDTPTVTDNSALLNFEFVKDGNTIDLNVVEGSTIVDSTIAGGGNRNATSAAGALRAIQDAGAPPGMNPLFAALNQLPTDAAVAGAVNSLTPAVTTAAVGVGTAVANSIQSIVQQRQNINMMGASGLNSGDPLLANRAVWFKPFGSWGKQSDRNGLSGFDLQTGGFGFGFDGEYRRNQKLGVALFYTNADVDMNSVAQKADIDVFTGLVYGNVPLSDKTQFLFQGGYTQQRTDTSRAIELTGETARGSYTAKVLNLDLKLQHDVNVSERFLVQPMVSLTYRHFKTPSYKESGSSVNQHVDGFSRSQTTLGIGAKLNYALDAQSKLLGHVHVGRDTRGNAMVVNTAFEGAPGVKYATRSADNGLTSFELGLGYERRINEVSKVNLMVTHQGQGGGFKNNSISAMYNLKF